MNEKKAKAYLKKKGKDSEDAGEIDRVIKQGFIYGDPTATII